MTKNKNARLRAADAAKKDEFYTQLSDIQTEMSNYSDKFKNKVVFCNCDDPFESNFVKYLQLDIKQVLLLEMKLI